MYHYLQSPIWHEFLPLLTPLISSSTILVFPLPSILATLASSVISPTHQEHSHLSAFVLLLCQEPYFPTQIHGLFPHFIQLEFSETFLNSLLKKKLHTLWESIYSLSSIWFSNITFEYIFSFLLFVFLQNRCSRMIGVLFLLWPVQKAK